MNHYLTLGLDPGTDAPAIRSAYRRLARRCHPDFGGNAADMARLNEAWRILGDPVRRASYDAQLAVATPRARAGKRGGSSVLEFGRYEGWTVVEIAAVDDDYLEWLGRTPLGRPLRAEIAEVIEGRRAQLEETRPRPRPGERRRGRIGVLARG